MSRAMSKRKSKMSGVTKGKVFEWLGVVTAIVYSLLVASNTGLEFLGFTLLLLSSLLIGIWAYLGKHRGILFLQFFYATAGIIGMIRWYQ
jgi:uncharacterized membrane protein